MKLANQFELEDMKRQVEDEAMKHLNDENTVELFFLAEKYEAERLKVEAKKGIKKHRKQINSRFRIQGWAVTIFTLGVCLTGTAALGLHHAAVPGAGQDNGPQAKLLSPVMSVFVPASRQMW